MTTSRWITVVALLLAVIGWIRPLQERPAAGEDLELRRLALLEEENTRLRTLVDSYAREKQDTAEEQIRTNIEQEVAEIRGLEFLEPVRYETLARADLAEVIDEKITEQYSPEELIRLQEGYIAMGLLPEGFDLRKAYLDLLGEQIAAFYDQFTNTLFSFENTPLRKGQNRVILAHELTHALQDQHFFLEKFPLHTKDNDDLVMATSALIEGDATLLMTDYMVRAGGGISPGELLAVAFSQETEQLRNAPRYLRESLLFSYVQGQKFAAALYARGGWRALDAAYALPPTSTSQILHPEKYLTDPGASPPVLEWTGWQDQPGRQLLADNVLGEFGWRTLLGDWIPVSEAEAVCTGWVADRYLVLDSGNDKQIAVWTVWETPQQADAFESALGRMLEKRHSTGVRKFKVIRPDTNTVAFHEAGSRETLKDLEDIQARTTDAPSVE